MPLKIAIGVHGRFHAFDLAMALRDAAPLAQVAQVATTYPRPVARRFLPPDIAVKSASMLEIRRRLYDKFRVGPNPDVKISEAFGRFAARTLPDDFDVFVGWSSASLEAIHAANARGKLTVVERGSMHIEQQQEILDRVYRSHGQAFAGIDQRFIDRELAEYAAADLIAVPTSFAAQTFIARGIDARRLLINPYGVDADVFAAETRKPTTSPSIVFVGAVSFQKGAPVLLEAFRPLAESATLRFVGPVETGWQPPSISNVDFLGPLDRPGVVTELGNAGIFCLPSHQEGLSLALLQAMSSGLPAVATAESGAGDLIEDGVEGYVVPAGDSTRLSAALNKLIEAPEQRVRMGEAARRKARTFTWGAYGKRAIEGYRRALTR